MKGNNSFLDGWLTEYKLEIYLHNIFDRPFIYNRKVVNSSIPHRPDYQNEELKLIVEFNGHHHYSTSKSIINDTIKKETYELLGYRYIEIPYFIQLTPEIIKDLFDVDSNIECKHPQGFIDDRAMLPADYCELGLKRFLNDLERFNKKTVGEVIKSLNEKIIQLKNKFLVIPPSIHHILLDI